MMQSTTKTQKDLLATEKAIQFVKDFFETELKYRLQLTRVSAPLVVLDGTGINDDLNGVERPVRFPIKAMDEQKAVVVHSLAKWKRLRLTQLEIPEGEGILTDMRALRPDEDFTPLHSIYVDQYDWEKHISPEQRNVTTLKDTVERIYATLVDTERAVAARYPEITATLPDTITFIHAEELLQLYPDLSPKERETEAAKTYGAIFIMGVGGALSDGKKHDGRAPDYDDYTTLTETGYAGLNGDIVLWHPGLECAFEISSMGIRVDKKALLHQLALEGCEDRLQLPFHQALVEGNLVQSMGGGIGQSRLCMFMLKKKHIGEVQVSIWPEGLAGADMALL